MLLALVGVAASGCQLPSPGGVNSQSSKNAADDDEGWLFRKLVGRAKTDAERPAASGSPTTTPLR